jgi:hypothetical protein
MHQKDEGTNAQMPSVKSPKWTESAHVVWALIGLTCALFGWICNSAYAEIARANKGVEVAMAASNRAETAVLVQAEQMRTVIELLKRLEVKIEKVTSK